MTVDRELVDRIRGFLAPEEGDRLFEIALEGCAKGPCLEIGGYCGKSTVYIGSACKTAGSILFSIDHHCGSEEHQPGELFFDPDLFDMETGKVDTFPAFRRALAAASIEDHVAPMVCSSAMAARFWTIPLGLVFIDGGHSDAAAFGDYVAWAGHVAAGGFLAIHDVFEDPAEGGQAPRRIYRLALGSGLFECLPMTGTLCVLRRRAPREGGHSSLFQTL